MLIYHFSCATCSSEIVKPDKTGLPSRKNDCIRDYDERIKRERERERDDVRLLVLLLVGLV